MPKQKEITNTYPELSKFSQPFLKVSTIHYNSTCEVCFQPVSQNKVHEVVKCQFCNVVAHVSCLKDYKLLPQDLEEVPKEWTCHFCVDTINYEVSYRKTVEEKKELERKRLVSQIMISKHWRKIQAWKEFQKVRTGTKQFQKIFIVAVRKKQFSHKKQQNFRPIKLIIHNIADLYMIDRDPKRVATTAATPNHLPSLQNSSQKIYNRDLPIYVLIHVFDLSSGTFVQAWRNETAIKFLPADRNNLYPSITINEDFLLGGVTGFHHIVLSLFQKGQSARDFFIGQCYLELSQNMNWRKGGKFQLSLQECAYSLKDSTGMEIKCDTRGEKPQGTISLELITSHGMTTICCSAQATSPEEYVRALSKYPVETLPGYILVHRSHASNSTSLTISTSAAAAAAAASAALFGPGGKKKDKSNNAMRANSPPMKRPSAVKTLSPLVPSSNNSIQTSKSNPCSPAHRKLLPSLIPPITSSPSGIDLQSHSMDDADDHGSVGYSVMSALSETSSIKTLKTTKSMVSLTSQTSSAHSPSTSSPSTNNNGSTVTKTAFKLSMKKVWIVIFSEKLYVFNHYGDQLKFILDLKFLNISYELNPKNKNKIIYNVTCPQTSRIPPFQFCAYYDHDAMLLKATMISSLMLAKKLIQLMESVGDDYYYQEGGFGDDVDSDEEHQVYNHPGNRSASSSVTRQSVMVNGHGSGGGNLPNLRQSMLLTRKSTLSNIFGAIQQNQLQENEERSTSPPQQGNNGASARHNATNISAMSNNNNSNGNNKKRHHSSHPYINQFFDLKQFVAQWKQLDMLLYPNKFSNARQGNSQSNGVPNPSQNGYGSISRTPSSSNFAKSSSFSFPSSSPSHQISSSQKKRNTNSSQKLKTGSVSFSMPVFTEDENDEDEVGSMYDMEDVEEVEKETIRLLAKAVTRNNRKTNAGNHNSNKINPMRSMNLMLSSSEMKSNSFNDGEGEFEGYDLAQEEYEDGEEHDESLDHSIRRSVSFKPFSPSSPIIK